MPGSVHQFLDQALPEGNPGNRHPAAGLLQLFGLHHSRIAESRTHLDGLSHAGQCEQGIQ